MPSVGTVEAEGLFCTHQSHTYTLVHPHQLHQQRSPTLLAS